MRARISIGVITARPGVSPDAVDVGGQLEIAICEPTRDVGPEHQRHVAVVYEDVGVVILDLGEIRHTIDEPDRLAKVREVKLLLDGFSFEQPPGERRQTTSDLLR